MSAGLNSKRPYSTVWGSLSRLASKQLRLKRLARTGRIMDLLQKNVRVMSPVEWETGGFTPLSFSYEGFQAGRVTVNLKQDNVYVWAIHFKMHTLLPIFPLVLSAGLLSSLDREYTFFHILVLRKPHQFSIKDVICHIHLCLGHKSPFESLDNSYESGGKVLRDSLSKVFHSTKDFLPCPENIL